MKIWLVGVSDCESTMTYYACLSKGSALKRWEELRLECLKEIMRSFESVKESGHKNDIEMYERMLKNLSETNPKKMSNYPHEEPFIHVMEAES